jgi:hypothetical protein
MAQHSTAPDATIAGADHLQAELSNRSGVQGSLLVLVGRSIADLVALSSAGCTPYTLSRRCHQAELGRERGEGPLDRQTAVGMVTLMN